MGSLPNKNELSVGLGTELVVVVVVVVVAAVAVDVVVDDEVIVVRVSRNKKSKLYKTR